jgi:hypothetical protein
MMQPPFADARVKFALASAPSRFLSDAPPGALLSASAPLKGIVGLTFEDEAYPHAGNWDLSAEPGFLLTCLRRASFKDRRNNTEDDR